MFGATNIEDVSRNVAGLSVQNLGPGQSQVGLRGISAGKTDRSARNPAGTRVSAGNNVSASAPARIAAKATRGLNTPGTIRRPRSRACANTAADGANGPRWADGNTEFPYAGRSE